MRKQVIIQILMGLLIGLAMIVVGSRIFAQPYAYQGSLIDPPAPAPDFALPAADGSEFRLSDHQGKIVMLYFGYTFCPDVCPTTLADVARVRKQLGDEANDLLFAMVTVDPGRDTPERLGKYVATFDPTFYGLSGDSADLEKVWADYGIYRAVNQVEGAAGYLVDHTARIYVIDRDGNLRLTFPFGMAREAMAADLEHLLVQ